MGSSMIGGMLFVAYSAIFLVNEDPNPTVLTGILIFASILIRYLQYIRGGEMSLISRNETIERLEKKIAHLEKESGTLSPAPVSALSGNTQGAKDSEKELQKLQRRIKSLEKTLENRDSEIKSLAGKLNSNNENSGDLNRAIKKLGAANKQLEDKVKELTQKLQSSEGYNGIIQKAFDTASGTVSRLENENAELTLLITGLEGDNSALGDQFSKEAERSLNLELKVEALEAEIEKARKQLSDLQEKHKESKAELASSSASLENLRATIRKLENLLSSERSEKVRETKALQKELKSLQKEYEAFKTLLLGEDSKVRKGLELIIDLLEQVSKLANVSDESVDTLVGEVHESVGEILTQLESLESSRI